VLAKLRCPESGEALHMEDGALACESGKHRYELHGGIPLFADEHCCEAARRQRAHYDALAPLYLANLGHAHTRAYTAYLDRVLLDAIGEGPLGEVAELCCGQGEAMGLLRDRIALGVGVDVSPAMLEVAAARNPSATFLQADAARLPLADASFDTVVMLGGVHHVLDRRGLFREVARILRPGGRFVFREPLDDFPLWRALRALVYRLSPALDHATERPLRLRETQPPLADAGLALRTWRPCGLFGFCLFMNGDVLVANRIFRFVPGIEGIVRASARLDERLLRTPPLARAGLQVVAVAEKAGPAPAVRGRGGPQLPVGRPAG
jgi:SAM-dependent methyltransferase